MITFLFIVLKLEIVFFNPSRNFTQFELVDGKTKQNCDEFFWSQIPNSNSCIPTCTGPCHALWLFGLRAVGHCFFNDKEILSLLNTILAGRREVYSHLNYPSFPLPTYVQSPAFSGNLPSRWLIIPIWSFSISKWDMKPVSMLSMNGIWWKKLWNCCKYPPTLLTTSAKASSPLRCL